MTVVIAGIRTTSFGMALTLMLYERGISQTQLADRAFVSRRQINRICKDHVALSWPMALRIETVLEEVTAQELLDLQATYATVHNGGADVNETR